MDQAGSGKGSRNIRPNPGQFQKGTSGNQAGRPPRSRLDSAVSIVRTAVASRFDGWKNFLTQMGTQWDKRNAGYFEPDIVSDDLARMLWLGDDICKRIIEAAPKTEMRRGINIKVQDKEQAEEIQSQLEDLEFVNRVTHARMMENALGGSALFPVTDDIASLAEEIDYASLRSIRAIHVLEPRELTPVSWDMDLGSKTFRQPLIWRFMPLMTSGGYSSNSFQPVQYIHSSRLIIFPGRRISSQLDPYQRPGWGHSRLTGVYPIVRDFGASWGHVAHLLQEFVQGVLSMDGYAELMMTDEGEEIVRARLRMMDMAKSTLKTLVVDGKDKYSRDVAALSGASDVLHDFANRIAAAAEQPVTVLFGMAPAGLNATGDNDVRGWYDNVANEREHHTKPRVQQFLKMFFACADGPTGGEEPDVWDFDFPPLWEPTEQERAQTRYTIAQTDQIYVGIDPTLAEDVIESRWKGDTFSPEMTIDWDRREQQKAADDAFAEAQKAAELERIKNGTPTNDPNDPNNPNNPNPNGGDDPNADPNKAAPDRPPNNENPDDAKAA